MSNKRILWSLLGATALGAGVIAPLSGVAQDIEDCGPLESGQILQDCVQGNAGLTVAMPGGPQTEPEVVPVTNAGGFSISLDGAPVDSDPTLEDKIRKVDLALEKANIQVSFDGFEPKMRLSVEMVGSPRDFEPGATVTLQSESNYPAFIKRAEFRVIDRAALGGARLMSVVPVAVNGQASVSVPEGRDVVVVHRVYDARGRYDETEALPLSMADDRGLRADVEELADTTAVRNIRVKGGAVTVYADGMGQGSALNALGTSARADGSGAAVIQRIVPPGDYDVDVSVSGPGTVPARLTRAVEVPGAEWFYVGVADLTWEQVDDGGASGSESRTVGRLQYYVDGETASGVQITSSLDTGEHELDEIFDRLDDKDPRGVLGRIDPEDTYPTFGDDSEIRDATPTSGRFYLKVAKDGNHLLWGDYQSTVSGNSFVRNERTLYGAQGVFESQESTAQGEAKLSAEVYVAQPDQLVGRETFQGTGGSVYFLRRQDITPGTETITVEIRDSVTGRVVNRQRLIAGRDYRVNYLQGVITLTSPLTGSANNNLIQTTVGGDQVVNLVTQYEFTPTTSDVDGFSYGGRVEGWVSDRLRLGATFTSDDTGSADQTSFGLDLRYEFTPNSFVQLDIARSDGPGYDSDTSLDGGLTINGTPAQGGTGTAIRLAGQADLQDLGYAREGVVGGYAEMREEGFSSLDYQVGASTGDETLYGAYARVAKTADQLGWSVYVDVYDSDAGPSRTELGVELEGNLSPKLRYRVGAEVLDQDTGGTSGSRFDLAGRLDYEASEDLSYYGFVQTTVSEDGLSDYDRIGLGLSRSFGENWRVEAEVSGGTGGTGGRVMARYTEEGGNSSYFGYELDTDRSLNAGGASQKNGGKYLVGGRRQVNDSVAIFGENTYDLFGDQRTLTSAYGLEYVRSDFLTYDVALEFGQIVDETGGGDLDRTAVSFGVRYEDEDTRGAARLELRQDRADPGASFNDLDAVYLSADLRHKIDEEQRLILSFDAADSSSDGSSVLGGQVIDASIGYAYRPILNERLNVLTRYRYLKDTFGQEIDGVAGAGARQISHVFSFEANYDLNRSWTLGGKIGGRFSQTATDATAAWQDNDAYLAVVNARYHMVHKWDVLVEARHLNLVDADSAETSVLGAVYKHVGNNVKVGAGYNFGSFSDDLTDMNKDHKGLFINIIAKF